MDAKSDYAENAVLDWLLGGADPTRPTLRYIGLYSVAPTDSDTGTEVSGGLYARQLITFSPAESGEAHNLELIAFLGMPSENITHFGIFDSLTGDNLLYYGELLNSITVGTGEPVSIPASGVSISER